MTFFWNNPNSKYFLAINTRFRKLVWKMKRKKLKNKTFTIFSDNCLGGFLYHDLNVKFNSIFINGEIEIDNYLRFLKKLDVYVETPLQFIKVDGFKCPFAMIGDIRYKFTHYKTEEEALESWNRRKQRLNLDNSFYIMTEKQGCTIEMMREFDALPYKNKVILTHKPYPEIKCAHYIKGFEEYNHCLVVSDYVKGQIFGRRYYDDFDFVKWLNDNYVEN